MSKKSRKIFKLIKISNGFYFNNGNTFDFLSENKNEARILLTLKGFKIGKISKILRRKYIGNKKILRYEFVLNKF